MVSTSYKKTTSRRKLHTRCNVLLNTFVGFFGFAIRESFARTFRGSICIFPSFQALVVMTDGISQDRVRRPALALRSQGVWVFALGIGRRYRKRQLQQIATNRRYVFTANFRSLNRVARRISRKICRCKPITQYSAKILSRPASKKC